MIQPKILKNNLKTVVYPLRSTEAITIMILIGVGSRDENQSLRGISHFLEHMFFKGGQKYKTAQDVALAIDSVGGDFNAFTGKEYTGYYVKTAKENVDVAFSVLSDMMMNARFDQFEIEKERGVILEEFNLYQDTPMYQIGWDFEHLLFGNQPLGWDQIGTKDNIRRFNQEDFINYKNDFYTEDNTTIVIAGNIDEDEGYRKIGEYFDFKNSVKIKGRVPYVKMPQGDKISITEKNTEQGHMVMGYLGVPFGDEREAASKLLSVVLGGNMSSRMFTEIREKRGLCYSVST
ncbi:MAG: insulinase family protein, partial [Candidatus Gracilibacteria bacterium]|nr:insulinase family protein [Candidatus Gracilibacteria bacterium]